MTGIRARGYAPSSRAGLLTLWLGVAVLPAGCAEVPPELGGIAATTDGGGGATPPGVVADQLIITVRPGAGANAVGSLLADAGVTVRDRLEALAASLVEIDPTHRAEVRSELEQSNLIEGVHDNHLVGLELVPNDELYPSQWHLGVIDAAAAWAVTTGTAEIVVAVLDSGVDTAHPDLVDKLWGGGNTYSGGGWHDVTGHGTAVAGVIAAAAGNQEGVASVAPGCPILPIRVTDVDGRATSWSLAAGIALAVESGAKVINISFTPQGNDDLVLRQAELARLAGALVVLPAGNGGEEVSGRESEHVVFVGATAPNDELARFSSFGAFVDLVAPGVGIQTTRLGGTYGAVTGSSYAAPIVAGVAALVWAANPRLSPATVEGILLASAVDLGVAGDDKWFGAGRVDAHAAVILAEATAELHDDTPPAIAILLPIDGDTPLRGIVVVDVTAADEGGVAQVSLWIDDSPLASDTAAPYSFAVQSDNYARGTHTFRAVATDIAGNTAEALAPATFGGEDDRTRPAIEVLSPGAGDMVSGVFTVLGQAGDDHGLVRAEVVVDGRVIGTVALSGTEARVAYNWNTASAEVAAGPHTLTLWVFDASGNSASASVELSVEKWH